MVQWLPVVQNYHFDPDYREILMLPAGQSVRVAHLVQQGRAIRMNPLSLEDLLVLQDLAGPDRRLDRLVQSYPGDRKNRQDRFARWNPVDRYSLSCLGVQWDLYSLAVHSVPEVLNSPSNPMDPVDQRLLEHRWVLDIRCHPQDLSVR